MTRMDMEMGGGIEDDRSQTYRQGNFVWNWLAGNGVVLWKEPFVVVQLVCLIEIAYSIAALPFPHIFYDF